MKSLLALGHGSRSTAELSLGIPLWTKGRSQVNRCQLRRVLAPLFTQVRSTNREHSRFVSSILVAIRHLAKSSRQSNERRNHVPRFKESQIGFRATSYTSRWLPPLSL